MSHFGLEEKEPTIEIIHLITNSGDLREIKSIIDEAADLEYRGIDYLGVGEPTFDEDFFPIIE